MMNELKEKLRKKGFTLAEMLITMLIMSIVLVASAPMLSQFSQAATGMNKKVMECITSNKSDWYNTTTGETSSIISESTCSEAITSVKYNRSNSLNTSTWFAQHGNQTQKAMAKKILRGACDQGGEKACDYFINTCIKNGSSSPNYCDDPSNFEDLTYYLHHTSVTDNQGAIYIYNQLKSILPKTMINLVNEVSRDCNNNQSPNFNQNLKNNLACNLGTPRFYIKACNLGIKAACEHAYDENYNRGCAQIKLAWPDATTGEYQLTADGDPRDPNKPTRQVSCNMETIASAAIKGCNANPYVPSDCAYGYINGFNRTCNQVVSSWPSIPHGEVNITSDGAPPNNPISFRYDGTCPPMPIKECPFSTGEKLSDGTIYAGKDDRYCYYTTEKDEPGLYKWGAAGIYMDYALSKNDGMFNTINLINSGLESTDAARVCGTKNDKGYSDWFLPSLDELKILIDNKDKIGGFSNSTVHWSSTQWDVLGRDYAYVVNSSGGDGNGGKNDPLPVRCARKERYQTYVAPNPANCTDQVGNVCSDGTIYAGQYNGYYYYTTPYDEPAGAYPKKYMWGAGGYYLENATSPSNGMANTAALLSSGFYNVEAAKACQAKNASSDDKVNNGKKDWYLPAFDELKRLTNNKTYIGGFSNGTDYWSSTQWDIRGSTFAFVVNSNGGDAGKGKTEYTSVRCIRRQLIH